MDETREVLLEKEGWKLVKITRHTGAVFLKIYHPEGNNDIELVLESGDFRNNVMIADGIRIRLNRTEFEDIGYYREFMEEMQVADEFAADVYKYCILNGFWDL